VAFICDENASCAPAFLKGKERAMQQQRRFKQTQTFEQRLAEEATRFRNAAEDLPQGMARELLLRRARQAETALHLSDWLRSPGLQPPK
jgi:hypothetical protein